MSDQATGQPKLQINQAMADLVKSAGVNAAAVRELLDRIKPLLQPSAIITGSISIQGLGLSGAAASVGTLNLSVGRAPLALSIDNERAAIELLTIEVKKALDALQL
jgi:hypothetical protein